MRFLVDAALSPTVAKRLHDVGHDAVHVYDLGMHDSPDAEILDHAAAEDRIVVSADTDFGNLLHQRAAARPSVILFRKGSQHDPTEQGRLLEANLSKIEDDLNNGCIAIVEPDRVRIRKLPLRS